MGRLDIFKQEMGLSDRKGKECQKGYPIISRCDEFTPPEEDEGCLPWVTCHERYVDDPSGLSY